jgi:hypothetical protein
MILFFLEGAVQFGGKRHCQLAKFELTEKEN